jgi:hypothetical protein
MVDNSYFCTFILNEKDKLAQSGSWSGRTQNVQWLIELDRISLNRKRREQYVKPSLSTLAMCLCVG